MKSYLHLLGVLVIFVLSIFLIIGLAFLIANNTNGTIEVNGRLRRYLIYIPETYYSSQPAPLVMTIHGYAEWPAHQAQISHWNSLADEYGFIVVYPAGTSFPLHWRTSGRQDDLGSFEDVQFLSLLIDQIESDYLINPKQIYVNGFSNGGGMTLLLSCQLQERIAAIGGISGAYLSSRENCPLNRPIPTILFHGTEDQIIPYYGGRSKSFDYPFPDVEKWVEDLANRNGCPTGDRVNTTIGQVNVKRYSNCRQNAEVVFYSIQNGGHAWPGGEPLPEWIAGYTTDEIDATELMWDFFQKHPLP